jgi:hypothetical protein
MLYPHGYRSEYVTMARLIELHRPRLHPEMARRFFPWLASMGGVVGIGSGWRSNPHPVSAASMAGKSFHQDQRFRSDVVGFSAFDLVRANPGGDHVGVLWADTAGAPDYGLHTFISGEPWHIQCVEMRGYETWRPAGRPDPIPGFPLPGLPKPIPKPPREEEPLILQAARNRDAAGQPVHITNGVTRWPATPVHLARTIRDHDVRDYVHGHAIRSTSTDPITAVPADEIRAMGRDPLDAADLEGLR